MRINTSFYVILESTLMTRLLLTAITVLMVFGCSKPSIDPDLQKAFANIEFGQSPESIANRFGTPCHEKDCDLLVNGTTWVGNYNQINIRFNNGKVTGITVSYLNTFDQAIPKLIGLFQNYGQEKKDHKDLDIPELGIKSKIDTKHWESADINAWIVQYSGMNAIGKSMDGNIAIGASLKKAASGP